MKTTRFDVIPRPDGARRVWWLKSSDGSHHSWIPKGFLMAPIENHVPEQPKSYAHKMLAAHVAAQ